MSNSTPTFDTGDILVVKGTTSIVSKSIALVTGSPYIHVAIALNDNLIFEIDWNVEARIIENPYKDYIVMRHEELTVEDKIRIISTCTFLESKKIKYDWWQIASFLVREMLPSFRANDINRYICTELVDYVFINLGIDLFSYTNEYGNIYPHEFITNPLLRRLN